MDTTHRKIELQSPLDLSYLRSNASNLARTKIDTAFPPAANTSTTISGPDMRLRVEELVTEYLATVFQGVRSNISVNGAEGGEVDSLLADEGRVELEAFDAKLARQIQDKANQVEELNLALATMRRTVPGEAKVRFEAETTREETGWGDRIKEVEEREVLRAKGAEITVDGLERVEEMSRNWDEALESLGRSKEGMGAVVGRLERARKVVEVLQAKTRDD